MAIGNIISSALRRIVGRFAGWFINFPALPNFVSTFHSLTGGLCTTFLTLSGLVFAVVVFYMEVVSFVLYADKPVTSSPFHVPLHSCLFLKYTLSPIMKLDGVQFVVFCACLNLFSSKVFLVMASNRWCDLRFRNPESGSSRNHCIGLTMLGGVNLDLFHKPGNGCFSSCKLWCHMIAG